MNTSSSPLDQELGSELNGGETKTRKRPRPGERRLQILQILAEMLQNPRGERVTTAALAAKIGGSRELLSLSAIALVLLDLAMIALVVWAVLGA